MISRDRKRAKFFKIEEYENEQGKIVRRAVYQGDYFEITAPFNIEKARVIILIISILALAAAVAPLFFGQSSYKAYIVLPQALTVLPLFFIIKYACVLYAKDKRVDVFGRADLSNHVKQAVFFGIIFAAATLIARIFFLIFEYFVNNLWLEVLLILSNIFELSLFIILYLYFKKLDFLKVI